MAVKTATFPGLDLVQESIRSIQAEAQKLVDRARKEANGLIGKNRRKTLDQLVAKAKSTRTDLQKRTKKVIKDLGNRASTVASRIETEATKRIEPLAHLLTLSSRRDVQQLSKRLASLEKKVDELLTKAARA